MCGSTLGAELARRQVLRSIPGFGVALVMRLWSRVFAVRGQHCPVTPSRLPLPVGSPWRRMPVVGVISTNWTRQPCQQSVSSPVNRVSRTLSTEFPRSSRKARIPCAVTLCGTSPISRKKSRPKAARHAHLGYFYSMPRVRQLCVKDCERHSPLRAGSVHGGETVQPCQQSVSNPVSRVSAALSQRICPGGTDRMEELQKHALTGENRVNGNEITLC